jgi:hypothetical protein
VKAVGTYGLNRTAQALRLDYYSLKRRVEKAASRSVSGRRGAPRGVSGGKTASRRASDREATSADGPWTAGSAVKGGQAAATFLELAPAASGGSRECILELEDPGGAKMRVHVKGVEAPDLAALSRSFWSAEA